MFRTRRLQAYPSGLCKALALKFLATLERLDAIGGGPRGNRRVGARKRPYSWSFPPPSADSEGVGWLNEAFSRGTMVSVGKQRVAAYLHVDDGVFASAQSVPREKVQPRADAVMEEAAESLEELGFSVKDRFPSAVGQKIVGYQWEACPPELGLDARREALLAGALDYLLRGAKVDVDLLRAVTGVWIWAALLNRPVLAALNAIFTFFVKGEGRVFRWWPSVRREVILMRDLVPVLRHRMNKPAAPLLFATDAEGVNNEDYGGYGMVAAPIQESLAEAVLLAGSKAGRTITALNGDVSKLKSGAKELARRVAVSRVPQEVFDAEKMQWQVIAHGRWRMPDHITLGEARGTLRLLLKLAALPGSHGYVVSSLMDNEAWSSAAAKGRSPTYRLNRILQQRAAISTLTNIELNLPWTDTARQPADTSSRWKCQ